MEVFYSSPENDVYKDIPIPFCFSDIFNMFLEMYVMSGQDGITWQSIRAYCEVRKLKLSQFEIDYIIKIRSWAEDQISQMREDSRNDMKKEKSEE